MKQILRLSIFVFIFAITSAQSMGFNGSFVLFFVIPKNSPDTTGATGGDRASRVEAAERVALPERGAEFVVSKFDRDIIKKFGEAWRYSGNGTTDSESVVLIFRMIDGRYTARNLGITNEHRSFTFRWHPGAIAIVHTHPNNSSPKPQLADCQIADKYGIPVFTLTLSGMFVYDPYTKQITRVQDGLNWLELSKWFSQ